MDQKKIRLTQPEEKVKELEPSNKDKDKLIRYQEASKYAGHFEKTKYTDNKYERVKSKAKESILKIVVIEKKSRNGKFPRTRKADANPDKGSI